MLDASSLEVFAPWRRVLRPLARFPDESESAAGTLHAKLRCVRLDFCIVDFLYDEHEAGDTDAQSIDDWRRAYLRQVREAVELIGLLLHYHKRDAWPWFYKANDFEYQVDELEPHFECTFHDTVFYGRGGDVEDVKGGIEVLTGITTADLSDEYRKAKQHLRALSRDNYDPLYRVPISFVLAPDKNIPSVDKWCACVCQFVQALYAQPRGSESRSWFDFVGMTLYIWRLRVDKVIVAFLTDPWLARVHIPEVDLNLVGTRVVHGGTATNAVCGVRSTQARTVTCHVDAIGLHESDLEPFVRACTSLMEAKSPKQLFLYDAFGKKRDERRIKWSWVGYALSGAHASPSSLRHLRLEDDWLTVDDVTSFLGGNSPLERDTGLYPPHWAGTAASTRCVRLATEATVLLPNRRWLSLSDLGLSHANRFVVLNDTDGDELITILVPGFGACNAKCSSVIDAFELPPPSSQPFSLLSLQCGVNKCEPQALRLLTSSIGHSLTRLSIGLKVGVAFEPSDAAQFAQSLPVLEYLELTNVGLGSMDVLLDSYDAGTFGAAVLSLTSSFVEPASMTRFARQLQDPSRRVSQRLREFRYIFEDSVGGACPPIITESGAAAFASALATTTVLTFLDIGLVKPVFDQYAAHLEAYDKICPVEELLIAKLASMSEDSSSESERKKPKPGRSLPNLPVERRHFLATHIRGFVDLRPVTRVVSVIAVPRE